MAETYSHIMTLSREELDEIGKKDYILKKKISFIKSRILKIYDQFRFPGDVNIKMSLGIK